LFKTIILIEYNYYNFQYDIYFILYSFKLKLSINNLSKSKQIICFGYQNAITLQKEITKGLIFKVKGFRITLFLKNLFIYEYRRLIKVIRSI
jgi:hypothetical protein